MKTLLAFIASIIACLTGSNVEPINETMIYTEEYIVETESTTEYESVLETIIETEITEEETTTEEYIEPTVKETKPTVVVASSSPKKSSTSIKEETTAVEIETTEEETCELVIEFIDEPDHECIMEYDGYDISDNLEVWVCSICGLTEDREPETEYIDPEEIVYDCMHDGGTHLSNTVTEDPSLVFTVCDLCGMELDPVEEESSELEE